MRYDTPRTRILVADDHTLFRHGLRALLESVADIELVGEAATGEEAISQTAALGPDVVLMDINMPDLNGIAATHRILEAQPSTALVVLTMFADDDSVFAAMRAGARGYVLKGADEAEPLRVLRLPGPHGARARGLGVDCAGPQQQYDRGGGLWPALKRSATISPASLANSR